MVTKDSDNKENAPGEKPPQMDNSASFLRAARAGNLEKVLEYLKGSIDINTSNANGLNALHLASKEGHVLVVKELLQRGAEVNAATKKGNTALHMASLAGRADVVQVLVEKGANVNVQSQNGFTPLYMAAQENHDPVVRFLLANNANQSLATEDGFTPLAVALQQGHDKVVAVLLENDAKGKVRLPALHIAAKKDDTKAAALLLQNEHNPDVTSKSGFTPLHIAAHYGNAAIAAQLLDKGADVNFPAKHQISPLHVAAKWGKTNMVKLLLDKGACLDASTRDGLTPLHCAARSGHDQVVDQLIDKGAPITAKTKNGLAPLHMASQGDHVESAKILLNHKAPVDDITVDYLTALHVAAHCGHVGVAKLLLDKKADANSRALNGFTPLHIACKKNRIKVVELLLRHGASIEATTESGLTPLHVASFMGCMNIVIYLIQHGANADVPTVRGETPLHLAARANQTDIVRILLRNGAQVDTRAREQQTPLHIAARLGNVDIVGLLLQHGANVDSATKDLYTSLHIAAKEGQEEVVNLLLDHGASVTAATKKGFTPLHLAAKYGHLKVGKLLLQRDAPVDAQGKNGVTPLHVAAHYDYNNIALLLLERGGSPHAAAKNGYTPLHIAAKKNQMDIGTTLLEYGAKTNAESKAGFTSLHLAAQEGFADHAALLIEHGANVNAAAKNGLTPLHLCAQEDKVNVAAVLAKYNCQIDPKTAAGYTPLHVACHFGQTNMIKFLLQHGADVNAATTQGYTPLHQAAQQGHALIINLLLENRAQPNATTKQGQTALSIAEKLGYISVIETLKVVTETTVTTTTTVVTEEKYKVVAPETMHETFMSDSEDEAEQDNMMGDHSFKYLTADEMKSLGDDSLPIDVTRDEKAHEAHVAHIAQQAGHIAPSAVEEDRLSPSHLDSSFAKAAPDNVEVKRTPVHAGFLVSFMVDARGGAMRGCRHSGVRVIIPPRRATMPMRVTCRFIRKEKLSHPPPLMEGEACAARVIEMGPAGAKFLGPVVIEVPHFASLRGKEREIVILRSDNGETWKEHTLEATEDAVSEVLNGSFDAQELNAMQDFNTSRVTRILTTDFPQFFAVVCRNRQEVHSIGPEGGMVSSTVVSQVQAIFPDGALTKKIKVGLQAQPIHTDMVTRLLGNRVAVSPIVTVEPRRRKFHKPITLTIPLPKAAHKGMTNQYQTESPTLRLLCSITGGQTKAQWEDVTGSTPLTFVSECVSFTTTVSARFWLIDCRQVTDVTKFATELYHEAVLVPFMAKFVVFAKRHELLEAQLRVFCMTDDREDKTLENQEHFAEVAKSRDVEVLEGTEQYLEFAGNLVPITKSGEQLALTFEAFKENRVSFNARVKDMHQEPMGRVAFMKDPRGKHQDVPQTPVCNLNIRLPEPMEYESVPLEKKYGFVQQGGAGGTHEMIHRADLHLSDIAKEVGNDWAALAGQLGIPVQEIQQIRDEVTSDKDNQALTMLKIWIQRMGPAANGNALEKALQNIGRDDIVHKCMSNIEVVTDDVEKAVAKVHLSGPGSITSVTKTTVITTSSTDERDIMKDAESAEDTSSGSARTKPTATPAPVEVHEVHQTTVDVKHADSKKEKTPESRKEKLPEKPKADSKKKDEPKKEDSKKQSPKREIPPPPKKEPPKKEKKEDPPKKDAAASKKDAKKESMKKKEEPKKEASPAPPKKETSPPKKEPSPAPPKKEASPPKKEAKKEEAKKTDPAPKKDSPKKEAPRKEDKKIKSPSAAPPEPPKKAEERREQAAVVSEAVVTEVIQKTEVPSTASPQKKKREGTPVDELSAELLEQIVRDDQDLALKGGAPKKAARDVVDAGPGGVMGRNVDIERYIKETTPEEIVIPEYRHETRTVTMTSMTTTVTREGVIGELGAALKDFDDGGDRQGPIITEIGDAEAALLTEQQIQQELQQQPLAPQQRPRQEVQSMSSPEPSAFVQESHEVLPDGTLQHTITKVTTTTFVQEEGQPPVELSTRLHESEAGASDADTSQVSVSSLPEDEGTVSSGLQHMQGIAARTSKEEESSGPGAEAMSFIEKKEYFETLATETAEVLSPTGGSGDFGRRQSQERQMTSAIETVAQEPGTAHAVSVASPREEQDSEAKPPSPPQEIKRLLVKTVDEGREVQEFVDLIKQETQLTETMHPESERGDESRSEQLKLEHAEIQEQPAGAETSPSAPLEPERKVDLEGTKSNQSARQLDTAMEQSKVKAGSGVDSDKADEVSSELPQAETKLSSVFGEKLFPSAAATKGEATLLDEAALEKFTVHSAEEFTLQHSEVSTSKTVVIQQSKDSLVMQEESPQKDFTGYDIGSSPTMLAHKVQMPLTPELERDDMLRVEYASEEIGSIQMETTHSMGQLSPEETDEGEAHDVTSPDVSEALEAEEVGQHAEGLKTDLASAVVSGGIATSTHTFSELREQTSSATHVVKAEDEALLTREVEQIAHELQEHEHTLEEELPLTPDVSEDSERVAHAQRGPTKEELEHRVEQIAFSSPEEPSSRKDFDPTQRSTSPEALDNDEVEPRSAVSEVSAAAPPRPEDVLSPDELSVASSKEFDAQQRDLSPDSEYPPGSLDAEKTTDGAAGTADDSESRKVSLETVSSDLTKEEEPSDFSRSELSDQVTLTEEYDLTRSPTMKAHAVKLTEEDADRLLHAQEYEEVLRVQSLLESSPQAAEAEKAPQQEAAQPELTVQESTPLQESAPPSAISASPQDYDVRKSPTMKAHAVKLTEEDADRLLHAEEYMEVLQQQSTERGAEEHEVADTAPMSIGAAQASGFDIRTSPTMRAHAVKLTEGDADRLLHAEEYLEVLQQQQQQLEEPGSYDIRTSPTMRAHAAYLSGGDSHEQMEEVLTITQEETVVTRQHETLTPDEPSVSSSPKDIDYHARGSSPEALSPGEVKPLGTMSQGFTEVTTTTVTTSSVQESSSTPVDEAMPRQDFDPQQRAESPDPEELMDQTEVPRFTMKTTKTVVETVVLPETGGEPVVTKTTTTKDVKYTDPEGVEHQMHSVETLGEAKEQQSSSIPKDIPLARALSEEQSETAISESSMVERELSPEPEAMQDMLKDSRTTIELQLQQQQSSTTQRSAQCETADGRHELASHVQYHHPDVEKISEEVRSTHEKASSLVQEVTERAAEIASRMTAAAEAAAAAIPSRDAAGQDEERTSSPDTESFIDHDRDRAHGAARDIIEELAEENDSDEDRAQHKEKTILLTMNDFSSSLEEEILETGSADSLDVDVEAERLNATSTESSNTVQEKLQEESEQQPSEVSTSASASAAAVAAPLATTAPSAAAALSSEHAADGGRGESSEESSGKYPMSVQEHPMAFENAAFRGDSGAADIRPGEEQDDDEEHGQPFSIQSSVAHLSSSTFTASVETLTITDNTNTTTSTTTTTTSGSDTVILQGLSSRQESKDESTISQDITHSASDSGDEGAVDGDDDEDDDDPKGGGVQMREKRDQSSSDQSKRQSYLSEGSSEKDSEKQAQVPSTSEQISSATHTSEYETASQGSKLTISTSSTTYKTAHSSTQSTISDVSDHSASHFSTATMGLTGDLSDASDTILESPIGPAGDRREGLWGVESQLRQQQALAQHQQAVYEERPQQAHAPSSQKQSPPRELALGEAHQPEENTSPMEELLRRYPYGLPSSGLEPDEEEAGGYGEGCGCDKPGMGGMLRKKRLSPILDDHGSTPDADSSSMKRSLGRGSERDDMSVCSLQEFERLEAEMAASKTSVPSSLESSSQLAGGLPSALSSSQQPADFERLEREMQLESLSSLQCESRSGMAVIQEHDMSSSQFGPPGGQTDATSLSEDESSTAATAVTTTEVLHRSSLERHEARSSFIAEQRNEELLDSLIEEIEHQHLKLHKDEAAHLDEDKGIEPDSLGHEQTPDFPDSLTQSRGEAALYDSLHEVKDIGEWDSFYEGRDEVAEIAQRPAEQRSTSLFGGSTGGGEQPDSGLFHSDDERAAVPPQRPQVTTSSSLTARGPLPADCKQIPESLLMGDIMTAAESHTGIQTSVTTRTITEVDYDSEGNPHEKTVTITTTRKVTTDTDGQQHVEETETRS